MSDWIAVASRAGPLVHLVVPPDRMDNRNVGSMLCPVMVGRSDEVDLLGALVRDVSCGRGGLVVVEGDAGIGKSRLAREARLYAQSRNVMVVTGRAVPSAATIPYRPLTEALLQALRARDLSDDPRLTRWLPMLEAVVPPVPRGETTGSLSRRRCAQRPCCSCCG